MVVTFGLVLAKGYIRKDIFMYIYLLIHSFCLAGVHSFLRPPGHTMIMSPIPSLLSDRTAYTVTNTQVKCTNTDLKSPNPMLLRSIQMIGLPPDRQHLDRPG